MITERAMRKITFNIKKWMVRTLMAVGSLVGITACTHPKIGDIVHRGEKVYGPPPVDINVVEDVYGPPVVVEEGDSLWDVDSVPEQQHR